MKSRAHYEKLFSSFPDVVTLPEFQSMLGGSVNLPQTNRENGI